MISRGYIRYLKNQMSVSRHSTIEKRKSNIRIEIQAVSSEILREVFNSMLGREQEFVAHCGGLLEILFSKKRSAQQTLKGADFNYV